MLQGTETRGRAIFFLNKNVGNDRARKMSSIVELIRKKVISSSHVLQIPPLRAYREISGLLSQSVPLAAYIILSFQELDFSKKLSTNDNGEKFFPRGNNTF